MVAWRFLRQAKNSDNASFFEPWDCVEVRGEVDHELPVLVGGSMGPAGPPAPIAVSFACHRDLGTLVWIMQSLR